MEPEIIKLHQKAGSIAHHALRNGAKLIKVGASMREVLDSIEKEIKSKGAGIAFPAQIALNNTAAHFCPDDEEDIIFKEGDIAKLDIGAHINGFVADTALTVNLGNHDDLTRASKEALAAALKLIRPGITLGEIGKTIQETINSFDLRPIRNLSGHGLGQYVIHDKPSIPNVATGDKTELKEGMSIAIEPFATNGAGEIYESVNPTLFSLIQPKPTRSMITREVSKTILTFKGLPFTTRWLSRIHGIGKVRFALREMQQNGSVIAHPPLLELKKGLVSQHEHSLIVAEKPIIYTRDVED